MNKNNFLNARSDASMTATVLQEGADSILKLINNCSRETAGELLQNAIVLVGIANQLLIDINLLTREG